MTGPHPDEDEQHVVIYVDASATAHLEAPDATPPPIERPGAMRQLWAAAVVGVVLGLLLVSAHVLGDALYNPPSRLPDLVFTRDAGLYGNNAAVASELDLVRDSFSQPGALELALSGPAFRLALPRTLADRLFNEREEAVTVFGASSPAGDFRFLALTGSDGARIFAAEAPLGLARRDQPAGVFLALDPADPALSPLIDVLEGLFSDLDGEIGLEAGEFYVFGPYAGGDAASLRARVEGNAVMAHIAGALEAAESNVSMVAPAFLVTGGPARGTINALYHPARRLVMEPLWGEGSTDSLAHELVHAYLDSVAPDPRGLLADAAVYFEDAHPVLHGEVVGDLYERLGEVGRAEETLAFLTGAIASGQTRTVASARLLANRGNLAISEAVLQSDVLLLIEAGLLPECMRPRESDRDELTPEYYEAVAAAC